MFQTKLSTSCFHAEMSPPALPPYNVLCKNQPRAYIHPLNDCSYGGIALSDVFSAGTSLLLAMCDVTVAVSATLSLISVVQLGVRIHKTCVCCFTVPSIAWNMIGWVGNCGHCVQP